MWNQDVAAVAAIHRLPVDEALGGARVAEVLPAVSTIGAVRLVAADPGEDGICEV